jgi:hypothetical protein
MPAFHVKVRRVTELEVDAVADNLDAAERIVGFVAMHLHPFSPRWKQTAWEVTGEEVIDAGLA